MTLPAIGVAVEAQRAGETTAVDLLERSLSAIAAVDGDLGSVVVTDPGRAMADAEAADRSRTAGRPLGRLHGIPVAVKDIIDVEGLPTRCGSPAYPDAPAQADAPVVTRLRQAGAVVFAKTVAHELACGVYSPPAGNPWNLDHIPGGSSGGSGAAVAAGLTFMALGSDTGGSIRIPAALCGVAGMKPTYGLVPKSRVAALSWSLDHIGPLARTVADCAAALDAIAGPDRSDPTCLDVDWPGFGVGLTESPRGLRVGVIRNHFHDPIQPDVAEAFGVAFKVLRELGCELIDVEIPELAHTMAAEFGIVGPEAAAYHRDLLGRNPELIDPGIRGLLVAGRLLPADHYLKARAAREIIKAAAESTFREHRLDVVVTPQLPATAATRDQTEFSYPTGVEDVTSSYVRTTAPFNLTGQPALSVPCGFDREQLPIGLQIAGRPLGDAIVLRLGHAYEQATQWHRHGPPVRADDAW